MRSKQGLQDRRDKQCLGDWEELLKMRQSREMLGKRTAAGNQSEHPHGLTLDLGAGAVRLSEDTGDM